MSFAGNCEAVKPCPVATGHSRSKNGVASLAYDPVVHSQLRLGMDCRIKSGNDDGV
jgi:hypothetical protein